MENKRCPKCEHSLRQNNGKIDLVHNEFCVVRVAKHTLNPREKEYSEGEYKSKAKLRYRRRLTEQYGLGVKLHNYYKDLPLLIF